MRSPSPLYMSVAVPVALAGGSWILLGVMVLIFFGVVIGWYTRKGSGISETPYGKIYGGAPGAIGKDDVSGKDKREKNISRGTK